MAAASFPADTVCLGVDSLAGGYLPVSFQTIGIDTVFSTGLPSSVAGNMR